VTRLRMRSCATPVLPWLRLETVLVSYDVTDWCCVSLYKTQNAWVQKVVPPRF